MSIRTFETGATRSPLGDKLRYEGFLNPVILKRYAEYMHRHRTQSDGSLREPDNWQKGMPLASYADSGLRHAMDWWLHHRGYQGETTESIEDTLCALVFNAFGYLLALENQKGLQKEQLSVESRVSNWVAAQPTSPSGRCSHPSTRKY